MVRLSRHKLKKEHLEKLYSLFFQVLGNKFSSDEFYNTIDDLLSPAEKIMLAKRIAIVYLLLKEIDYQIICDVIKVSPSTVAKFRILMEKSTGIVPTFKNILKREKIVAFIDDIFMSFTLPGTYGVNWKNAWQRKFEHERKKTEGI